MQLFLENDKSSFEHESSEDDHESSDVNKKQNQNGEVQLKGNIILPYFVALEKLFNIHDAYIKKKRA